MVWVPFRVRFAVQGGDDGEQVLDKTARIAIEAGLRQSWDWLLDETDSFIGMTSFGASAPIDDLYNHFSITADAVVAAAKRQIG